MMSPSLLPRVLACVAILLLAPLAAAQSSRLDPARPRAGTEVEISYNPRGPLALFNGDDTVYVVAFLTDAESTHREWKKMSFVDGRFLAPWKIPEDCSFIAFCFLDPWGEFDPDNTLTTSVFGADDVPQRGGAHERISIAGPREFRIAFEDEKERYPDDRTAYRTKWLFTSFYARAETEETIRADLELIGDGNPTDPIMIGLQCLASLHLGDEAAARDRLATLLVDHPTLPWTETILGDYRLLVSYRRAPADGLEEIALLERELATLHPEAAIARGACAELASVLEFPFEDTLRITKAWIEQEPTHPTPYLALAEACVLHDREIDLAWSMVSTGLDHLLRGRLRLHDDLEGSVTAAAMPAGYRLLAEIARKRGDLALALPAIQMAQLLESAKLPEHDEMEGMMWQELGDHPRAADAYRRALQLGSTEADALLATLYGNHVEFDEAIEEAIEEEEDAE